MREFPGWQPDLQNLRAETEVVDGQEVKRTRAELHDDDIVYLQETYTVTDGIFLDENVLFDAVTPEWEEFCRGPLAFEPPADEPAGEARGEAASAGAPA
jgi:hypothetical protein